MMIREANTLDKFSILKFCKDTFSWGDYVDKVWDFWLSEKNLFIFEGELNPIGICHALYANDQVWIEGIRIDPNFRRKKIASKLIIHAESIGKKQNLLFSYMLIDTENIPSLTLAKSLNYNVHQTWNFYSLESQRNPNYNIYFEKNLDLHLYSNYVQSWRWFSINNIILSKFYQQNKIIRSTMDGKSSIAILTDSEHFEKTLIVTLFSGSQNTLLQIISFLQNYGFENEYERIQILTKDKLLPCYSLNHKLSFHLMKKSIS